jgi:hypothetical protein
MTRVMATATDSGEYPVATGGDSSAATPEEGAPEAPAAPEAGSPAAPGYDLPGAQPTYKAPSNGTIPSQVPVIAGASLTSVGSMLLAIPMALAFVM